MYKVKRFSVFYNQKEYGNKQNKALKNAWVNNQTVFDRIYRGTKVGIGLAGGYESKANTVNRLKDRFQKEVVSDIRSGELGKGDIKSGKAYYTSTGIDELRNARKNLNQTKVQGVHDAASTNINERINSRANGGVTGKSSYTYKQRDAARQNMASKSTPKPPTTPVATQTPTPKSSPTPQSNVNNPNKSRGLLDKGRNLWSKSGKLGKAGIVTAGLATIGAGAYGVNKMMTPSQKAASDTSN